MILLLSMEPVCAATVQIGHFWSGYTPLFETSQRISFVVSNVPNPSVNPMAARLDILARGDYSVHANNEYLEWFIDEGVALVARPSQGEIIRIYSGNDLEWRQSFDITPRELSRILADNSFTLTIDNSGFVECCQNSEGYIDWTLTTVVPLPASAWLLFPSFVVIRLRLLGQSFR
jgi:hypothetical protein